MNDTTNPRHGVVVGVDGSADSDLALDWAIDEAQHRQLPLHLVHARGVDDWWAAARAPVPPELINAPDPMLADKVDRVSRLAPDLQVTSESSVGRAPKTLIDLSRAADVVAVGARGRGPVTQMLLGSVSAQVATHARCPVVVVRRPHEAGPDRPRIVVGLDGSSSSQDAVAYAFEQASARGLGLTVVHAWARDLIDGLPAPTGSKSQQEAMVQERQTLVSEALAGWRAKYPDLDVRERLLRAPAPQALLAESPQADLLVLGSRGLGGFTGLLLGSVSRAVLQRATCPVAIVRTQDHHD